MRQLLVVSLFAVCLGMLVRSNSALAQTVQLSGTVTNQTGQPLPGLTISLVHPIVGRSFPVISDPSGHFNFRNISVQQDSYFIEISWGPTLLYRKPLKIQQSIDLGKIVL